MKSAIELLLKNCSAVVVVDDPSSTVEEQQESFDDGYLRDFENLGLDLNVIGQKEKELGDESMYEGNEDEISERELETIVSLSVRKRREILEDLRRLNLCLPLDKKKTWFTVCFFFFFFF